MKKEAEARRAAALAERLTKIREEVDMQPRAKPSKQRGERAGEFDDFIDETAARERLDQKKRPKDRKRQRYGGEDEAAVLEGMRVFLAPSDDEGGEAEVDPEARPRPLPPSTPGWRPRPRPRNADIPLPPTPGCEWKLQRGVGILLASKAQQATHTRTHVHGQICTDRHARTHARAHARARAHTHTNGPRTCIPCQLARPL
jgi:hypothetical protein